MSSHDCRVEGCIDLKPGVNRAQVVAVLDAFLTYHDLNLMHLEKEGGVEHDESGDQLYLSIRVFGFGGHANEQADDLAKSLEAIAADDQYFEFIDDDTGEDDARCSPYFIGDPRRAQLEYGIQAMGEWVKPVIGEAQYAELVGKMRALPLLERKVA